MKDSTKMEQAEIASEVLRLFSVFAQQVKRDTHGARVVSLLLYGDGAVYFKFRGLEDLYSQLVKGLGMENTFKAAAEEAARIMAEMPRYRTYRITYAATGEFLSLWTGENAEHARNLCAEYYRIARKRLVATLEL